MAKPTPAARLRKTFHYPSSDDDDSTASTPEVLDEQEQETLIKNLTTQNHTRNTAFLRLLAALPLLSTIPFLLGLALPHPTATSRLLPLLGLSSLLATGCMLVRLGVTETGFRGLDGLRRGSSSGLGSKLGSGSSGGSRSGSGSGLGTSSLGRGGGQGGGYGYGIGLGSGSGRRSRSRSRSRSKRRDGLLGSTPPAANGGGKSPLETHLPWLNAGLAVLALLTGLLERVKMGQGSSGGVSPVLLGALPGVVYAVVVGAKVVMAGVDPEMELRGLKYSYKGA